MTPEERQMLAGLFERINANSSAPRDAEAESFISDAVRKAPFSPYILAQTALVQQQALEAAAHRIAELEAAAHEAAQQQGQGGFLGNLGRSLFGGGAPSAPPRPDPNAYQGGPPPQQGYAPPPQQGYPPPPPPQYARSPARTMGRRRARRRRAAAEASSRTRRRRRRASPAASRSATFSAACSAATRAAACSAAAASAARDWAAGPSRRKRDGQHFRRAPGRAATTRPVRPGRAGRRRLHRRFVV